MEKLIVSEQSPFSFLGPEDIGHPLWFAARSGFDSGRDNCADAERVQECKPYIGFVRRANHSHRVCNRKCRPEITVLEHTHRATCHNCV